ncbi:hybrid sensor histidine kinase/response regulator [Endothiovibrio diazotrophicus]
MIRRIPYHLLIFGGFVVLLALLWGSGYSGHLLQKQAVESLEMVTGSHQHDLQALADARFNLNRARRLFDRNLSDPAIRADEVFASLSALLDAAKGQQGATGVDWRPVAQAQAGFRSLLQTLDEEERTSDNAQRLYDAIQSELSTFRSALVRARAGLASRGPIAEQALLLAQLIQRSDQASLQLSDFHRQEPSYRDEVMVLMAGVEQALKSLDHSGSAVAGHAGEETGELMATCQRIVAGVNRVYSGLEDGDLNEASLTSDIDAVLRAWETMGVLLSRLTRQLHGQIRQQQEEIRSGMESNLRHYRLLTCVSLLFGALVALFLFMALHRRLLALVVALRAVREGRFDVEVPVDAQDDIGRLGQAFNEMNADLRRKGDELRATMDDLTGARDQLDAANRGLLARVRSTNTLLDGLPVGIILVGRDRVVRRVNRAALEMMRRSEREVVGQICHNHVCPADRDRCPPLDLGQAVDKSEKVLLDRDGRSIPILKTVVPIRLDGEELLLEAFFDISERKQMESAMAEAIRNAEKANRAKSEFLANMSHELRTPMNAVLGYAQLLQGAPGLGEEQRGDVEEILTAGRHLLELINEVLDLAKMEAGRLELEQLEFVPAQLVEELAGTYGVQARAKGIELDAETAPTLPELVVGDPTRLRQVLVNLLGNAIKFTERGRICLAARPAEGEGLLFEVSDSGIGIDAAVRDKLFQPFTQADESMTRRFGGTGLGLALCRKLVEAMGGEIGVDSEPGRGSRFWVRLPLAAVPLGGKASSAARSQSERAAGGRYRGRVLVVEDNAVNRQVAVGMLVRFGLDPDTAADGEQALARLEEGRYDLVLMDLQMPVLDGDQATRRLREREQEGGLVPTPVVALTAYAMAGDREAALAAGMDDYLTKPVSLSELEAVLERWLSHEEAS